VEWKYVDREIDIHVRMSRPSIRFNCDLRAAYTCDTRSPAKPGKSSVSNNLGVTRHVCLASHQSLGKFSTYGLLFLSSISQHISCRLELAPCPAFEEGSPTRPAYTLLGMAIQLWGNSSSMALFFCVGRRVSTSFR
jgi:hypothetical protein